MKGIRWGVVGGLLVLNLAGMGRLLDAEEMAPDREAFRIDEMDLQVGAFREEAFGERHSLFVSRKNIVDLREKSRGVFVITGVRRGVVYIDEKTADDALVRRLLVRVGPDAKARASPSSPRRDGRNAASSEAVAAEWQAWCGRAGLRCRDQELSGTMSDWPAYAAVVTACQRSSSCSHTDLQLATASAAAFAQYLGARLGSSYRWWDMTQVPLVIEAPCRGAQERSEQEDRVSQLLGKISDPSWMAVRCHDEVEGTQMLVRIKAFFLTHEEAESIGMALGKPLLQGAWRQVDMSYVDAYLSQHAQDAHLAGEPTFKTLLGVRHQVEGGSEFLIPSRNPEKDDQWKKSGLSVDGVLWREGEDTYLWRYQLGLSEPRGSDASLSLTANRLAGEVRLKAGEAAVVGSLLTKSRVARQQKIPWFSDWPIIGPLLRHKEETQVEGRLFVRVEIEAMGE